MKKILILALFLIVLTSLFSCQIIDKITGKETPTLDDVPPDAPATPVDASDMGKLNALFEDMRASVTIPESTPEISDVVKNELSKLDFSIEDFELDGEWSNASVIFKNNTLYISDDKYANQIIRFTEHGILTVSESEEGVTSSLVTFDQLLEAMPSSDVESILDAFVIKQGDLQKTDTEHVYTVNRSLLLRLGKAFSGNSDFTIDKNSAPKITIDMREYDSSKTLKISVYDKSSEETTDITVSLSHTDGATRLDIKAISTDTSCSVSAIFDNELRQLDLDYKVTAGSTPVSMLLLSYKKATDNTSVVHLESMENGTVIRADVNVSALGDIDALTLNITAPSTEENATVTMNITYDSSAISKVGEAVASVHVDIVRADAPNSSFDIWVITQVYSQESAYYFVRILTSEDTSSDQVSTGSTKIYSPANSEPKISDRANLYFKHGSNIITNYPAYLAKAEALNNQMISLLGTSRPSASQWMTYDSATGIYYITTVTYSNGAYVSTTHSTPDAFRYAYGYAQNLGGFTKEGSSLAEREARRLAALIEKDIPKGASDIGFGSFYTYTYIAEYDVYLMFAADFPSDFLLLSSEPDENATYDGAKIHKLTYDKYGNVKMHSYEEVISEWNCCVTHKCSHCGLSIYSYEEYKYEHSYIANAYETDADGNKFWEFVYCDRCGKCEVNIFKGELTVTLALEEMTQSILDEIRRHEGMEDFTLSTDDFVHSLVVTRIEFNGEFSSTEAFEIVFPELSKFCDYRIIGIDDGMYSYSNHTPLHLVLSSEVEFINEMAFMYCEYLRGVTATESLRFIGRMAFIGCENLTELIYDADGVYVGEDAFSNTPIQSIA